MQRQMKAYSSSSKLIVPIITFTAHIPLTSLARSRHFSTFSYSLALPLPSSGIVTIILSQLSSFCRYSPSTVSSPHFHDLFTQVPQGFVSSFSSKLSGTWSYHSTFHLNSYFPDRSQRPSPATLSCLLLYFCCLRQFRARANNMANCLITLLAHYYRY